ncbi:MAG: hypothetical protein KKD46_08295 [Euryarchaeota archaeon]|nr:hypothetical protein [Euryarchaeota archaeon]MBU4340895.1 hypothetical protein [Euryarchaeota archaeon]MCG2736214.1 hypothetical protein [Candidatus Methanoperedenaceae archaeon]
MECYNELQSLTKLIAVHGDTDCDELMGLLPEHKVIDVEVLISPGSAIVPGIAEPSAIELEIIDKRVKGKIIRCTGDVCNYFTYEKT